jgi:hypothetical protein
MIWIDYVFFLVLMVIFLVGIVPTAIELIKEIKE